VPLSALLAIALAAAAGVETRKALQVGLIVAIALIALHGLERRWGQLVHPPALADVPSPVADGVQTTAADARDLRGLLAAIDRASCPGDPILVAPPRFDQVTVGDPLLYILARRTNPTRYDVMQPGVVTTAKVQREMIADLERTQPPLVVRWNDPRAEVREPNGSGRSSGVTLLDDYLAAHYRQGADYGPYRLLERRFGDALQMLFVCDPR
jgi:hypothetical protein